MLIVGITGGTGCGKTTIVHQLLEHFSKDDTILISQDDYYHDLSHLSYDERVQINFDHPDSIDFALLEQHLKTLKKGSLIEKPEYSFVEHNRSVNTRTIVPKRIILLEGILIFTLPEIRKLLDLKIYIKAHSDIRLQRRIKRDVQERGRDIEEITERYENTLKPMHERFIAPVKQYADLIITNNEQGNLNLDAVYAAIQTRLS